MCEVTCKTTSSALYKSPEKILALLSRQTLYCRIKLCISQWNRFVDTVALQIMNDNIVCTHYAVSLNDCCQQKQAWIWCVSFSLFTSAFVFRMLTRQHPAPQVVTVHSHTQPNTHADKQRHTTSSFPVPLLSKGCKPTGCFCCFCPQSLFSMSSLVCSVYKIHKTWYVTAPHSQ